MTTMMKPGKRYRLRPHGGREFVDGFFENHLFFEGQFPVLRVGFVDRQSNFFYRHSANSTDLRSPAELAGKISGLTLIGLAGGLYHLVEVMF